MVNINDLKDILTHLKGKSNVREEDIIKMFEWIIDYLEEKELQNSGYYD